MLNTWRMTTWGNHVMLAFPGPSDWVMYKRRHNLLELLPFTPTKQKKMSRQIPRISPWVSPSVILKTTFSVHTLRFAWLDKHCHLKPWVDLSVWPRLNPYLSKFMGLARVSMEQLLKHAFTCKPRLIWVNASSTCYGQSVLRILEVSDSHVIIFW